MPEKYALNVRMTNDEKLMLVQLQEADGLSISDVIRQLIRKAYEKRFGHSDPQSEMKTRLKPRKR